jgi:hypothetical protein
MRFGLLIGATALAAIWAAVNLVIAVRIWTDYCPSSGDDVCVAVVYEHSAWMYLALAFAGAALVCVSATIAIRSRRRGRSIVG